MRDRQTFFYPMRGGNRGIIAMFRRLPARVRATIYIVMFQLIIGSVFRGVFAVVFRESGAGATAREVLQALYLGMKFDLRLALVICLPFLALSWVPGLNPIRSGLGRGIWLFYFVIIEALLLFIYFVDFGHYAYLGTRLNAGLIEHLQPIGIAMQMFWETYPVVRGVLGLLLLAAGYGWLIRVTALRELQIDTIPADKWTYRATLTIGALVYALGIYGNWSWYPLRWSAAFFSTNGYVSALALNPALFFVDSFPNRELPYDRDRVREHYRELADYLGVDRPDLKTLSFVRRVQPTSSLPQPANLVVIHLESFAGFKTGILGNKADPTPHFDTIARDSVLFTNFFTNTGATARSVFAMITGIPDLNTVHSASRNPRVVAQHTLVNALDGYEKFYFLGGSATWGNIRGLLAHNIRDLHVYEEGDYDAPREDAWGVSDLALFEKANTVLTQQTKPFFAFIQTAGNHRPYTIPEDRKGFQLAQLDAKTLSEAEFESLAAYNGIRLLDYSLGHFFELARKGPYFANTVFVIYGDHGVHAVHPIPWEQLLLTDRWVPLAIYAPGFIKQGRRIATVASLIDMLPTVLSLMGVPYVNTTLGRDLLAARSADQQLAFTSPAGLLSNEFLLRVDPQGESQLYRYRTQAATVDVSARHPEETARLRRMHDAFSETSRYLLYHNPPRAGTASEAGDDAQPDTRLSGK